jgi:hypothetical protein
VRGTQLKKAPKPTATVERQMACSVRAGRRRSSIATVLEWARITVPPGGSYKLR